MEQINTTNFQRAQALQMQQLQETVSTKENSNDSSSDDVDEKKNQQPLVRLFLVQLWYLSVMEKKGLKPIGFICIEG